MQLVQLTADFAEQGFTLSTEAGWNQSVADWNWMLNNGFGFGMLDTSGHLIATSVVIPYETAAWLSMVLVTPARRREGIATMLVNHCISFADQSGIPLLLDATEAGARVYLPLGFRALYKLNRWVKLTYQSSHQYKVQKDVRSKLKDQEFDPVEWDRAVTGLGRGKMISYLINTAPELSLEHRDEQNQPVGYCLGRKGRVAVQIGPLIAQDVQTALDLLDAVSDRIYGSSFIDVPEKRKDLEQVLSKRGFVRQRAFIRMARGRFYVPLSDSLYAVAGPEFG